MKVSLITTILNEEKSIGLMLDSVAIQTQLPDELVIVDAGSTDRSLEIIESFNKRHKNIKINLITKPGVNRSEGRNLAIEKSQYQIITATDAGCELDKDWLKNVTVSFKNKDVQVVAGKYEIKSNKISFLVPAINASVDFQKVDPANFLPSSRSIAFRKNAWKHVGGYPEKLNTAEDLVFAQKLHQHHLKQDYADQAIVYWYPPQSFRKIVKQFYNYAYGDGRAGLESKHSQLYIAKTFILFVFIWLFLSFYISINQLIVFYLLIILLLSVKKLNHSLYKKFLKNNFILVMLVNFSWVIILFPITLFGFWLGWSKRIINYHEKK